MKHFTYFMFILFNYLPYLALLAYYFTIQQIQINVFSLFSQYIQCNLHFICYLNSHFITTHESLLTNPIETLEKHTPTIE